MLYPNSVSEINRNPRTVAYATETDKTVVKIEHRDQNDTHIGLPRPQPIAP